MVKRESEVYDGGKRSIYTPSLWTQRIRRATERPQSLLNGRRLSTSTRLITPECCILHRGLANGAKYNTSEGTIWLIMYLCLNNYASLINSSEHLISLPSCQQFGMIAPVILSSLLVIELFRQSITSPLTTPSELFVQDQGYTS